jgi:hypothetical protein
MMDENDMQVDSMKVIEKIQEMPNGPLMVNLAVQQLINDQQKQTIEQLRSQQHSDRGNPIHAVPGVEEETVPAAKKGAKR